MIKVIATLKRKSGLTQKEFSSYWYERHGPLIVKTFPNIRRYVQNHSLKLPGGGEPRIDGVVETWYDDMESWQKSVRLRREDCENTNQLC